MVLGPNAVIHTKLKHVTKDFYAIVYKNFHKIKKNETYMVDSEGDIEYMIWESTGHNGQRTDKI